MSEKNKSITNAQHNTQQDAKQKLNDFLSPISSTMFKPPTQTKQATEPVTESVEKPISEPTQKQTKKATTASKSDSKKGQQRKVKAVLKSKPIPLNVSSLNQPDLTNLGVEELEVMAADLVNSDFARIPINKQIVCGLKMALGSKKNMHQLGNTVGLILLQLFRPDILEAIKKMPPKKMPSKDGSQKK